MADLPTIAVRLFGKLPSHGDFIARGFAAAQRDALDGWLSSGLDAACTALGPAFAGRYDQAPPWRFAAMEGDSAIAGVLAPSIDRAGRRYPVYLALAGVAPGGVGAAADWCEGLIRDAFCTGWDADQLVGEAARFTPGPDAISISPATPVAALPCWWVVDGDGGIAGHMPGCWPAALLSIMLQPQEER